MYVPEGGRRVISSFVLACVLVGTIAVLPLRLAVAQDFYKTVSILESVADGELTLRQATAMLDRLREQANDGEATTGNKGTARSDKVSEEKARAERASDNELTEAQLSKVKAQLSKLKAAVKNGKVTKEEAIAQEMEIRARAELECLEAVIENAADVVGRVEARAKLRRARIALVIKLTDAQLAALRAAFKARTISEEEAIAKAVEIELVYRFELIQRRRLSEWEARAWYENLEAAVRNG